MSYVVNHFDEIIKELDSIKSRIDPEWDKLSIVIIQSMFTVLSDFKKSVMELEIKYPMKEVDV